MFTCFNYMRIYYQNKNKQVYYLIRKVNLFPHHNKKQITKELNELLTQTMFIQVCLNDNDAPYSNYLPNTTI